MKTKSLVYLLSLMALGTVACSKNSALQSANPTGSKQALASSEDSDAAFKLMTLTERPKGTQHETSTDGEKKIEGNKAEPSKSEVLGDKMDEDLGYIALSTQENGKATTAEEGNGPMECYRAAPYSMSVSNTIRLCEGAASSAPAACYMSTPASMTESDSITLCRRAPSARPSLPMDCYRKTGPNLPVGESVRLCESASSDTAPMNCYRAAPYSMTPYDTSILCAQATTDRGAVDCYLKTGSLNLNDSVKLCSPATRKNVFTVQNVVSSSGIKGVTVLMLPNGRPSVSIYGDFTAANTLEACVTNNAYGVPSTPIVGLNPIRGETVPSESGLMQTNIEFPVNAIPNRQSNEVCYFRIR